MDARSRAPRFAFVFRTPRCGLASLALRGTGLGPAAGVRACVLRTRCARQDAGQLGLVGVGPCGVAAGPCLRASAAPSSEASWSAGEQGECASPVRADERSELGSAGLGGNEQSPLAWVD